MLEIFQKIWSISPTLFLWSLMLKRQLTQTTGACPRTWKLNIVLSGNGKFSAWKFVSFSKKISPFYAAFQYSSTTFSPNTFSHLTLQSFFNLVQNFLSCCKSAFCHWFRANHFQWTDSSTAIIYTHIPHFAYPLKFWANGGSLGFWPLKLWTLEPLVRISMKVYGKMELTNLCWCKFWNAHIACS